MKCKSFLFICFVTIAMQLLAQTRNQNDGTTIILTQSGSAHPNLIAAA